MSFLDLDHAAQLAVLERSARSALSEQYEGLAGSDMSLILQQYEDNAVWRADAGDGRSYVVRLSVRDGRTPSQQRSEMRWLGSLATSGAPAVSAPVGTKQGDHVVPLEVPGHDEPCTLAVLAWLPGEADPPFREAQVARAMGEANARLQENAVSIPLEDFDRPTWDWSTILDEGFAMVDPGARDLLGRDGLDVLRRISDRVAPLLAEGASMGRIHGDLHRENLLALPGGGVGIIDFDDCGIGDPLLDVATELSSVHRLCRYAPEVYASFVRDFAAGYRAVRPLPTDFTDRLDAHLVLRDGFVLNFICAAITTNEGVATWGPRRIAEILSNMRGHFDGHPYPGTIHPTWLSTD